MFRLKLELNRLLWIMQGLCLWSYLRLYFISLHAYFRLILLKLLMW